MEDGWIIYLHTDVGARQVQSVWCCADRGSWSSGTHVLVTWPGLQWKFLEGCPFLRGKVLDQCTTFVCSKLI